MKRKCYIEMTPIPENFIGVLQLGRVNAAEGTNVIVQIRKPFPMSPEWKIPSTVDISSWLPLAMTEARSPIFSYRYPMGMQFEVFNANTYDRIFFIDPDTAELKDAIRIPFLQVPCTPGFIMPVELTTKKRNAACLC